MTLRILVNSNDIDTPPRHTNNMGRFADGAVVGGGAEGKIVFGDAHVPTTTRYRIVLGFLACVLLEGRDVDGIFVGCAHGCDPFIVLIRTNKRKNCGQWLSCRRWA